MAKLHFTDAALRDLPLPSGAHRIDYDAGNVRGFAIQTTRKSQRFLLVYVAKASGLERRMVIGEYGKAPKLSISAARKRAAEMRALVDLGRDPWQEAKDERAAAQARRARSGVTLGGMLLAYVDALRRSQKASAKGVHRELLATVKVPHPRLWKKPADEVTLPDLVTILNSLTRAKKWRQAEKTRSYLRAAYTMAAASKGNASTSDLFADYASVPNIGRDLATIDRPKDQQAGDATAKRALSVAELAAYWKRIRALPAPAGPLLRFHLLTGAQRCAMLARLTTRDVDRDTKAAALLDFKGRRKRPREHVVPLLPEALEALDAMAGKAGPYAFTTDQGANGAGFHAVRSQLAPVVAAMVEAGEVAEPFTPGELRITVETRLAAAGVSKETRAHLQSHGLGGVQDKHYDKHKYLTEKRDALLKLRALLDTHRGKVIEFPVKTG